MGDLGLLSRGPNVGVSVPRVDVRVKVDDSEFSVDFVETAKDGKKDRVCEGTAAQPTV